MAGKKKKSQPSPAQLAAAMANLAVSSAPKRKPKTRRKKSRRSAFSSEEGTLELSKTELGADLKTDNSGSLTGHIDVLPEKFGFLAAMGKAFELIQWVELKFTYRSAVGANTGGLVTIGFDWDWDGSDLERTKLYGYTPNMSWPVSAGGGSATNQWMVLPPKRLMTKSWYQHKSGQANYTDKGPGKLHYAVSSCDKKGVSIGEILVSYRVRMRGTTPAS